MQAPKKFWFPQTKKGVLQEQLWLSRDVTSCHSAHAFLIPAHHSFPGHLQRHQLLVAGQRDFQTHFLLPVYVWAIFLTWLRDRHFLNISSSPFHSSGRVVNWTHISNLQSGISLGPGMGGRNLAGQGLLSRKLISKLSINVRIQREL